MPGIVARGRLDEAIGGMVRATGLAVRLNEVCELRDRDDALVGLAEVVGFAAGRAHLSVLEANVPLATTHEIVPTGRAHRVAVGDALCGRILDGFGRATDGRGALSLERQVGIDRDPPPPLSRRPADTAFRSGVAAIDLMLTSAIGQRSAIFAAPGVGKSALLSMIARHGTADIVVVVLTGERGREVREFVERGLGTDGMRRAVIVAATSDRPPIERIRAAQVGTAIAEWFRERGRHVLLVVDSLTRLARAQREIGLAIGEAVTRRGYPPSVYALLPRLIERAGTDAHGSITAFYTVLTEGAADDDPIADEVRSLVDGHIVLDRALADSGHFPAIDVVASASRLMPAVASAAHRHQAAAARALLAAHEQAAFLLRTGEYRPGADAQIDRAIVVRPRLMEMLRQPADSVPPAFGDMLATLERALSA